MELMMYFFRSALVLFVFYLVYQLVLKDDAHFSTNRWFLLIGLVAALILPLVKINYVVVVEEVLGNSDFIPIDLSQEAQMVGAAVMPASVNWNEILVYLYLLITSVFLIRVFYHIGKMLVLKHSSQKIKHNGVNVCINSAVKMPFAFGNNIFLSDTSYINGVDNEVLIHEKVHLQDRHWIDVFLCELFIVIQWFNPLAWVYSRLVKQNLEFIADRGVLNKGFGIDKYIQTIICETMGAEASVLANHFRFSQNKRRLKMMKNDKKSKWRLLKLLVVLPLIGGLLWAFSEPVYEYRSNTEIVNDNIVQDRKDTYIIKGYVGATDTIKVRNAQTNAYETKIVEGGSPLPGTSIVVKGTTHGCVADRNGEFELNVTDGDVLVFSFVGFNTQELKVSKNQKDCYVVMSPSAYELDASAYRAKYKGKMTPPPPPPPPASKKQKVVPPPPPPPSNDGKPVFYVVEEMPSYQGGMDGYFANLYTYISQVKEENDLSGVVKVQFTVSAKGEVINVKALNIFDKEEAKYAVEMVSELDSWQPGVQRGKPVSTTLVVPVEFD